MIKSDIVRIAAAVDEMNQQLLVIIYSFMVVAVTWGQTHVAACLYVGKKYIQATVCYICLCISFLLKWD